MGTFRFSVDSRALLEREHFPEHLFLVVVLQCAIDGRELFHSFNFSLLLGHGMSSNFYSPRFLDDDRRQCVIGLSEPKKVH